MADDLFAALVARARSAAFASDGHRRAWEAVRTAALLRRDGRHGDALELLDAVVDRFRYDDVVAAAYACAVAAHCDAGDPRRAIVVGRCVWESTPTPELARALARAYWEHAEATGAAEDRDDWSAFARRIEEMESRAG